MAQCSFQLHSQDGLIGKIIKAKYDTDSSEYKSLSPEAKDLISHLLERDPKKRYTLFQADNHPWLQMVSQISESKIIIY